jgi:precorrin-2 dehydrogenase/sirohydrochlorin ferrochelatase
MKYFPINLSIADRKVVVVGGGQVARRKVKALKDCGARVTVVSPVFCAGLRRTKGIRRVKRCYRKSDLQGTCLVVSATDSQEVNRRVWKDATAAGILVNVVDQPDLCTFVLPATVSRGDLLITVSTAGGSPALARRIREKIEKEIDPAFADHLSLLQEIRPTVKATRLSSRQRTRLFKEMAGEKVLGVLKRRGKKAARKLIRRMLSEAVEGLQV